MKEMIQRFVSLTKLIYWLCHRNLAKDLIAAAVIVGVVLDRGLISYFFSSRIF